jgi:hypothetical protein
MGPVHEKGKRHDVPANHNLDDMATPGTHSTGSMNDFNPRTTEWLLKHGWRARRMME